MARRAVLIALAALAAALVVAKLRYRGKAPSVAPDRCDADLWKHVYRPARLRVLAPCAAAEGRVLEVRRNADGDVHLELDPDDASVLNLVNATHRRGHLVVEAICEHESEQEEVRDVCAGFHQTLTIPAAGDRIRAIGAYVTDRENGWNEIHPVTRIDVLR